LAYTKAIVISLSILSIPLICKFFLPVENFAISLAQQAGNNSANGVKKDDNPNNPVNNQTIIVAMIAAGASVVAAILNGYFWISKSKQVIGITEEKRREECVARLSI
jgi:hypothetical protein